MHNLLSDSDSDEDDYLLRVNLLKPVAKRTTAVPRALKSRASTTPRLAFNRPEASLVRQKWYGQTRDIPWMHFIDTTIACPIEADSCGA
eukprot:COSAG02_NODE_23227_length_726_cov_0.805423_1_plen_89_part_00